MILQQSFKQIEGKVEKELIEKLEKVTEYSHIVAPEHVLATYGDEERVYCRAKSELEDAERFLQMAEFSWRACDDLLKEQFGVR